MSADEEAIIRKYGRKPKSAAACLLSRQQKRVMFDSADYAQTHQKPHPPTAASGPLSQTTAVGACAPAPKPVVPAPVVPAPAAAPAPAPAAAPAAAPERKPADQQI